jgi:hypothetical protein
LAGKSPVSCLTLASRLTKKASSTLSRHTRGMKNILIGALLLSDLVVIGHVVYLKQTTPIDVKAKCLQEKIDYFYENQYIDCLARNGR